MGKGLIGSFGAGLLVGVDRGLQRNLEQDRQRKRDQREQDEHNLRIEEAERVKGDRVALADAARPVSLEEGAGGVLKPESADNRDVGQADGPRLADMKSGFRVAGRSYTDRAEAENDVTKANT